MAQHFWTRGYFVSTAGRDEQAIREYIRYQEKEDRRLDHYSWCIMNVERDWNLVRRTERGLRGAYNLLEVKNAKSQ